MPSIEDLSEDTRRFFKTPVAIEEEAIEMAAPFGRRFSHFSPEDMGRVAHLVDEFTALLENQRAEEALAGVLQRAREAAHTEDPELVKWALTLFITHDPTAARLPIPSLEEAEPQLLAPSLPREPGLGLAEVEADPETLLNWFREDPWANQHHQHWHAVYPWGGYQGRTKDRGGELFIYMHQQMLARYDTERIAAGLPLVVPLDDYRSPIPGGYDPGGRLRDRQGRPFLPRPSNMAMSEVAGIEQLEQWRDRLNQAVAAGFFDGDGGSDRLGDHTEASIDSTWGGGRGDSLHNIGHGFLGDLVEQPDQGKGVIIDVRTAIRDPLFYRWHRHIDDISYRWQERQEPNDPARDAPPVRIRAPINPDGTAGSTQDVILALERQVPHSGDSSFDGQAWATSTFGGDAWDQEFARTDVTTDELLTRMEPRTITFDDGPTIEIEHLVHEPFFFVYRVENTGTKPQPVTLRVFLAAAELADNRRMWIEMDRFSPEGPLPPGRHVLFRPADFSSVIRKSSMPPEPIEHPGSDRMEDGATDYCQCGWPYNLLLPRSTKDGTLYQLFVIVTDGSLDTRRVDEMCGSMSFCGLRDEQYPDRRAMGYPFDRPFAAGSVDETIRQQQNMAIREFRIRWQA